MKIQRSFQNLCLVGSLSLLGLTFQSYPVLATPDCQSLPSEALSDVNTSCLDVEASQLNISTIAQVVPEITSQEPVSDLAGQVTPVTQLSDVQPTDWAFRSLQSLIKKYGVVAGYPDNIFQGTRAMTRYEFAAALDAALGQINELMAQETLPRVFYEEDLVTLQRLREEFSNELVVIQNRVDSLDNSTAELEAKQFSTTTTLSGLVVFAANSGGFSGDRIIDVTSSEVATDDPNPTFLYRATLALNTSFTGDDTLAIWLESGSNGPDDNVAGLLEPTFGSVLDYSAKPPVEELLISRANYTFSPFQDITLSLGPVISLTDYIDSNSYANLSFLDFSTQVFVNNYILFPIQGLGAGAAVEWNPSSGPFTVRAAYLAASASKPNLDNSSFVPGAFPIGYILYPDSQGRGGLFGDPYQGVFELEYSPSDAFTLRLQYTGGSILGGRFDVFGANLELALSEKIAVFGRYGYGSYAETAFGDIKPSY